MVGDDGWCIHYDSGGQRCTIYSDRPLAVFLGSSSALVVASLLGALAGGSVATVIPSDLLQLVASLGFLVIGFRLLWPLLTNQAKEPDETDPSNS